ncbi:SdpI family protein [Shimazuella kribbensis]|uniref:SdpI family protein n=1 Tax=Shimazuella kribbensis TaxID=139808 RepID=UPI00040F2E77|nr:SdpI family protein [Shimazuella kribbensis]
MNKFVLKGYLYASLIVCILTFIIHLTMYPQLPNTIPYHWNFEGEVDKTGPKYIALFWSVFPFILYLLFLISPKWDPKKEAYDKHKRAYSIFGFVLVLFFSCISIFILLATIGYSISIGITIGGLFGALALVLGNYMRQIRPNYFFGIKTPWTLSSEQNWRKTHRLGSMLFALVGVYLLIGVFVASNWWMLIGILLLVLVAGILYLYSYLLHRKDHNS